VRCYSNRKSQWLRSTLRHLALVESSLHAQRQQQSEQHRQPQALSQKRAAAPTVYAFLPQAAPERAISGFSDTIASSPMRHALADALNKPPKDSDDNHCWCWQREHSPVSECGIVRVLPIVF
jgi:hypothetical protein